MRIRTLISNLINSFLDGSFERVRIISQMNALLNMATGGVAAGLLGANFGYGRTWHQFCCHECQEAFKVRMGVTGSVKEVKRY